MTTKNESNNRDSKGKLLGRLDLIQHVLDSVNDEEYKLLWISQIIDLRKIKNARMKIQDVILSEMKNDSLKIKEIKEILTKEEVRPIYSAIDKEGKIRYTSIPWTFTERVLMILFEEEIYRQQEKKYYQIMRLYLDIPKGKTSPYNHIWQYSYPFWVILTLHKGYNIERAARWILTNIAHTGFKEKPSIKAILSNMQRIDKYFKKHPPTTPPTT